MVVSLSAGGLRPYGQDDGASTALTPGFGAYAVSEASMAASVRAL